jgi:hypothetical protein
MKTFVIPILLMWVCLHVSAEEKKELNILDKATKIIIGPPFGEEFDPTCNSFVGIEDKDTIQNILSVTINNEPEFIDHILLLPHLQLVVLDDKSNIIAAFAFDRTSGSNSGNTRAVLRSANLTEVDGAFKLDFGDMFMGFPCVPLEAYRLVDKPKNKK